MRISDWSSDVCSSDLFARQPHPDAEFARRLRGVERGCGIERGVEPAQRLAHRPRDRACGGGGDEAIALPHEKRIVELGAQPCECVADRRLRSEEHTSELQSLMRISYAVFCWKKKTN